jgi:hypothetical protein
MVTKEQKLRSMGLMELEKFLQKKKGAKNN